MNGKLRMKKNRSEASNIMLMMSRKQKKSPNALIGSSSASFDKEN